MPYVILGVCVANLITFAQVMPRFAAPNGWPAQMRWLSFSGLVFGCAGSVSVVRSPASYPRLIAAGALALLSQLLFQWAIRVALRHHFAVAFVDARPPMLIEEGPYRWMAHPLYMSYAATWWALAVGSTGWAPTVGALVMSTFYVTAAVSEDRILNRLRPSSTRSVPLAGRPDEH